jgi:hypothetical protein
VRLAEGCRILAQCTSSGHVHPGEALDNTNGGAGTAVARRGDRRYRMASLRRLSLLLSFALPVSLAPGCSPNTSTKGQLITCTVGSGGAIGSCVPTTSTEPTGPNQCIDVDEDGDDDPHDDADEADGGDSDLIARPGDTDDDDGDGTPDSMDDDDDNDGVPDTQDCDELPGGDHDDSDDVR